MRAIILAAGSSKRYDGMNKLEVEFFGFTLPEIAVHAARMIGARPCATVSPGSETERRLVAVGCEVRHQERSGTFGALLPWLSGGGAQNIVLFGDNLYDKNLGQHCRSGRDFFTVRSRSKFCDGKTAGLASVHGGVILEKPFNDPGADEFFAGYAVISDNKTVPIEASERGELEITDYINQSSATPINIDADGWDHLTSREDYERVKDNVFEWWIRSGNLGKG
jgi:hypothetical protein